MSHDVEKLSNEVERAVLRELFNKKHILKMKPLFISLYLIFLTPYLWGQNPLDDIKKYLVKQGVIEKENINRTSIYALELLDNKEFNGTERYGIYRIGIYADHSLSHLLLLNNGDKIFLDCFKDLSSTLNMVFAYFEDIDNQFTDSKKLLYIRKIVDVYIRNMHSIPW